jgi:purine-binding chemotaxis protein CheW
MGTTHQFCTFTVADMYFGVEVQRVQEVIRYQELTRVPTAAASVSGLINLRGQIVTAIDLRTRLGLPAPGGEARPMNVVVRGDDGAVSLLVDDIGDVIEVEESARDRPPSTLSARKRQFIAGVFKLKGRLLLVLDTDKAVDLAA